MAGRKWSWICALLLVLAPGATALADDARTTSQTGNDLVAAASGGGDVVGVIDQGLGLWDSVQDVKPPAGVGPAQAGGYFFDAVTIGTKTWQACQKSGVEGAYTFVRETSSTVAGSFSGEAVGAAAFAAVVGAWGPTWAAVGGAIAGYGAKWVTQNLISGGVDWFVQGFGEALKEGHNVPQTVAGIRKAHTFDLWRMELYRGGQPLPTPGDIEMWSHQYDHPDEDEPVRRPSIDEPPPVAEHQVIGTWALDTEALLASTDEVARRIGRDPERLREMFETITLELSIAETGNLRLEGRNPDGSISARAKWRIAGRNIEVSEVSGGTIPPLLYRDGTIEMSSPDMQGMRLVFRRR